MRNNCFSDESILGYMVGSMIGDDFKLSVTFKGDFIYTHYCEEDGCDGGCGCSNDVYENDIILTLNSSESELVASAFVRKCNKYGVDRLLYAICTDNFKSILTWDNIQGLNRYNRSRLELILREADKLNK